jgi:alpha-galactosidase
MGLTLLAASSLHAQQPKPPIMGWSSWNQFRINIDEQIIRGQADALVSSGLQKAGYYFINIDDGYFGGRDTSGKLFVNQKFSSGMPALVSYLHGKGLKAGIYTDVGANTCGSVYDKDSLGLGVGIYEHIASDCQQFFKEWQFDFLKVDWCGGEQMKLDEQTEYTKIIQAVKAIDSNIVLNVCRWKFPGTWVIDMADSWRTSGDIQSTFSSILKIIDGNADLYRYASPGHYNDMDMLQVGRGMSYDEDKTHFSMWCLLNSPLLAGNDLRSMTSQTIEILTNKELIALNQDIYVVQGRRLIQQNGVEVWGKPLATGKAIAILNRSDAEVTYTLQAKSIDASAQSQLRDLWLHRELGKMGAQKAFTIPRHGIVVLKVHKS